MPYSHSEQYIPSLLFRNGHLNTVISNILKNIPAPDYERVRIDTTDDDFLDLDFSLKGNDKIVIISHGLEGSSDRDYMRSFVHKANLDGYDALAWNMRGCSGESNRLYSSYHSGKTEDLEAVIQYVLDNYDHNELYLMGFSLGGNLTLKYMGERGEELNSKIKAASALSVPIDLTSSAQKLAERSNWIYMKRFIRKFIPKLRDKSQRFPEYGVTEDQIRSLKNFSDFDALYTAPAHGFANAEEYWAKNSSKPFIEKIKSPSLLINSLDDPFLTPECFPVSEAKESAFFHFESTFYGGHVGYMKGLRDRKHFWYEDRIMDFFKNKA